MNPGDMGEPILDGRGLLCDPHQLRVIVHALLVLFLEMEQVQGNPVAEYLYRARFTLLASLFHNLVCEDVAPDVDEPKHEPVDEEKLANLFRGDDDLWRLFDKTVD